MTKNLSGLRVVIFLLKSLIGSPHTHLVRYDVCMHAVIHFCHAPAFATAVKGVCFHLFFHLFDSTAFPMLHVKKST